ncbi:MULTISPECIES: hypothetical protein [unclassified Undibacterium]|uniref:hypothetical protein n=1 Tax=unclassified Undibacterium TaxID=2630295 RepID=UPI002AC90C5F|nr:MULTISPECIES: hypothetical protein [unclassified Undibacterium]MEB0140158.1 hypothetical protein [Undibacterium sp. CCC2.1]MEB0172468.1 hypothetical protein [Undibacterium sp. CCC1.1]MEB0176986.1 hypothetical protein [Undibacterium sp. CCC3.4]MEB0215590.1 hypothetical protein [Undibacterium sp. 5I2]WPX43703.1 hypothetical protein RHM61_00240 [Undibacterium sp. CCC3.4]
MPITYSKSCARLIDIVTVEDAEELLQWVQQHPKGKIDLAACVHLHAAVLQVLMAARLPLAAWPDDAELSIWLQHSLNN